MPDNNSANSKRIAMNTIFLYLRMVFLMVISLFTSRVLLNALGVVDFGIQNVVGGFVSMFQLVSGTMATTISRFFTYEMGLGNKQKLNVIFSTSINIQIAFIGLIIIIAESFGIWFLNYKMVIPPERLYAANWVFLVYSHQKSNDYRKEIAALCDIHKDITFHVARHTFATTITLDHGVPIESVSKMLGHTNVQTTQIYARITDRKINSDMAQLSMKIDPLADAFKFPDSEYRAKKDAQRSKELKKFAFENGVLVVPS